MKCQKNRSCVKSSPNSIAEARKRLLCGGCGLKLCTGCNQSGKDKIEPFSAQELKKIYKKTSKRIKDIEKAHKATKNSKLQFDSKNDKDEDANFKKRQKEISKILKDLVKFEKDSMKSFKKNKMQFD